MSCAAMFSAAIRAKAGHGLQISPIDRRRNLRISRVDTAGLEFCNRRLAALEHFLTAKHAKDAKEKAAKTG